MATSVCHRLPNGLPLTVQPVAGHPMVAVHAWVQAGPICERRGHAGIGHLVEHMVFRNDLTAQMADLGGQIGGLTSHDHTLFYATVPKDSVFRACDVLAAGLARPAFDAHTLRVERDIVAAEICQEEDADDQVLRNLFATTFQRHPYGRPVVGNLKTLQQITQTDLAAFHRTWYTADRIHVVVAGDVDPSEFLYKRDLSFGRLFAERGNDFVVPSLPRYGLGKESIVSGLLPTAHLALGFRGPPKSHEDAPALEVLLNLLGGNASSALQRFVVHDLALADKAHAYWHTLGRHSLGILEFATDEERLKALLINVSSMLDSMIRVGPNPDELRNSKQAVLSDHLAPRETVEDTALALGTDLALLGSMEAKERYVRSLEQTSADDLRRVAKHYLSPNRLFLSAKLSNAEANLYKWATTPGIAATPTAKGTRLSFGTAQTATSQVHPKGSLASTGTNGSTVEHTLPNGMHVVVRRDPTLPKVSLHGVWPGGLYTETKGNNGISALLAATLTQKCGSRSVDQLATELDGKRATYAAMAGRNSMGIRMSFSSQDWPWALSLIRDCLLQPPLDSVELLAAKNQLLEELQREAFSPAHEASRLFWQTMYPDHPYGLPLKGTVNSLREITATQVRRHYDERYPLDRFTLAIVGDIEPTSVIHQLEHLFAQRPKRPKIVSETRYVPAKGQAQERIAHMPSRQTHIVVGFAGVSLKSPDRFALEVLAAVLGSPSGRLVTNLRNQRGLLYQLGVESFEGVDAGHLVIHTNCPPERTDAVVSALREELDLLVRNGVSEDEVKRAQGYLSQTHRISTQRRSSVATAIAFHAAHKVPRSAHDRYEEHIHNVTRQDVADIARETLDWSRGVSVTVMPPIASPEAKKRMIPTRRQTAREKKKTVRRAR